MTAISRTLAILLLIATALAAVETPTKLDRIHLANGRTIVGLATEETADTYSVIPSGGGGALTIRKDRIVSIERGVEDAPAPTPAAPDLQAAQDKADAISSGPRKQPVHRQGETRPPTWWADDLAVDRAEHEQAVRIREVNERQQRDADNLWVASLAEQGKIGLPLHLSRKAPHDARARDAHPRVFAVGSATIRVIAAYIGTVPFENDYYSTNPNITLMLRIGNTSTTQLLQYRSMRRQWLEFKKGHVATAADEFGNTYAGTYFSLHDSPLGACGAYESIYPNTEVVDILTFERPVDAARRITFTLPCAQFKPDEPDLVFSMRVDPPSTPKTAE